MKAIKEYIIKNKKAIIKLLILLGICVASSLLVFLILWLTNVITFDDGVKFNVELFESFATSWYGYLIFFILQVVITIALCFAPGGTTTFIALAVILYGANVYTFLLLYAGVIASSVLMDLLGRYGGTKVIIKLFGQEDFEKGEKLLKEKGTIYLPVMYLFPLFPDDLLCCLGGLFKVNFWYHLASIVLCRGIGIATIVFGINLIPYETFTTPWEWIVCITAVCFWIFLVLKGVRWIDKKYTAYCKKKEAEKAAIEDKNENNEEK